jgi:adenylosuccinate synthase
MMKGDVLSGFETLSLYQYNYKGKNIAHFPYNIEPKM